MADVGSSVMTKFLLALFVVASVFSAVGCNSGEVTDAQQKAKKDALQAVSDKDKDPNREVRPQ